MAIFIGDREPSPAGISRIHGILEKKVWNNRTRSHDYIIRKVEEAYENIKNIDEYGELIEKRDFTLVLDPTFADDEGYFDSKEKFRNYVTEELLTIKTFDFFCPVAKLEDFPVGIEVGFCDTLLFDELPSEARSFFIERWQHDFDYKPERYTEKKELIERRKKYIFFKLSITAVSDIVAGTYAGGFLEKSMHILRFQYSENLGTLEPIYKSSDGKYYLSDAIVEGKHSTSSKLQQDNSIEILTRLCYANSSSDIEERIWSAAVTYSISTTVQYYGVMLTLLCSALEILLLNERENLSYKLAERVAFLIGVDKKNRIAVFNDIVKLYEKRSKVIHAGKYDTTENEVNILKQTVKTVVHRLIDLRNEGFTSVSSSKDPKSVLHLITAMKFGAAKRV